MAHAHRDKRKLLGRVSRLRGQLESIAKQIDADEECAGILQTIAACRGALNGLMAEVLEDQIRHHVVPAESQPSAAQQSAVEDLIDVVNSYLR
jgi:FrmR/RcnR family transcriptional regulator, repressor of frmRAB operon